MKVLGIVGSGRKNGNTQIMMEEALKAAAEAGAETELFSVVGKDIAGCDGCHVCMKTHACKIKDDMGPLYEQMKAADAILLGSPVYFHGVTAQTKAVMDRCFCFLFGHELKNKVGGSLLVLRRVGSSQSRAQINTWFLSQGMHPLRGAVGYGAKQGEVRDGVGGGIGTTALGEAADLGRDAVALVQQLS